MITKLFEQVQLPDPLDLRFLLPTHSGDGHVCRPLQGLRVVLAVATDHADPGIVPLLLARKPDVNLKSKYGETALAWAARFYHPAILLGVQKASARIQASTATLTALEHTDVRHIGKAAEKGLALVQRSTATFFREGCGFDPGGLSRAPKFQPYSLRQGSVNFQLATAWASMAGLAIVPARLLANSGHASAFSFGSV